MDFERFWRALERWIVFGERAAERAGAFLGRWSVGAFLESAGAFSERERWVGSGALEAAAIGQRSLMRAHL
jgi:hypothetical protein